MIRQVPVNNQNIRQVTKTKDGWKCELLTYKNNELVHVKDNMFWDFNIPKQWLERNHVADLDKVLLDEALINILQQYINYIDDLIHKCKCRKTNLYKNGEFVLTDCNHPKNTICQHILKNKQFYPAARVGERNGSYWLVGIEMNIKGIYFYENLEARPVVDGKEIIV